MYSSKSMVLLVLLVATLVSVDGEGFFARRRNQKKQQDYQRHLMASNFRQRIGPNQGNSYFNARELPPTSVTSNPSNRDLTAGAGAAYSTSNTYDDGTASVYRHDHHLGGINPLSLLVAPLAALALLGAAATVASNPVLLSIAVLSKRKRRDLEQVGSDALTPEVEEKLEEMETLEKYISQVPGEGKQQEKLMATYLSCSGFTESNNFCLDRVVCDYSVQPSKMADLEKDVISIVLFNIMSNGYIPQEFKERLRTAAQYGRTRGQCSAFVCDQLSEVNKV